ncbi:MAG: ABC transporter ATP-binding protein [Acidimicrobiales bacterium]
MSAVEAGTGGTLRVRGLSKSYGARAAVDHVDLTVGRGESVGLVGPNGAGKTTLFDCICGQVRPDEGTVAFSGRDLSGLAPWRRARMGIGRTFQRIEVFPELTVRDHLLVADRVHHRAGRTNLWRDLTNRAAPTHEELARVDAVLAMVGVDGADVPVAALDLGTCRLVELARALVGEPALLLADEPSSGLDEGETREIAGVLRALQATRGMAVLLVEHDLAIVEAVVDRVVVMDLGRVVASGTFGEVMGERAVRRAYLGTP